MRMQAAHDHADNVLNMAERRIVRLFACALHMVIAIAPCMALKSDTPSRWVPNSRVPSNLKNGFGEGRGVEGSLTSKVCSLRKPKASHY